MTIFHGRRGRVSFRCSINKSAVVWENEDRLPVKWSSFLSGRFRSTFWPYLCHIFAIWRENQTGEIKVFKRQLWFMKSSVDEIREKEIAFLQGNFDNVRFWENYCFAVHIEFDLLHSSGEAREGEKSQTLFLERWVKWWVLNGILRERKDNYLHVFISFVNCLHTKLLWLFAWSGSLIVS